MASMPLHHHHHHQIVLCQSHGPVQQEREKRERERERWSRCCREIERYIFFGLLHRVEDLFWCPETVR